MTWTTTPPTKPGYYWLREFLLEDGDKPSCLMPVTMCRVNKSGVMVWGSDCREPWDYFNAGSLWAGPIVPPE